MRYVRGLCSGLVLLLVTVGAPVALLGFGRLGGLRRLGPQTLLQPDDGSLLLAVLTLVGWLAYAAWLACLATDVGGRIAGRRWRLPGLGWGQALVAGLVVALLALGGSSGARSQPTAPPRAAPIVQTVAPRVAAPAACAHSLVGAIPETPALGGERYIVAPGDDLWSIAERLLGDGLQWRVIVAANPIISDPDHIEVGWELIIPGAVAADPPPPAPAPPPTPAPDPTPQPPAPAPTFERTETSAAAILAADPTPDVPVLQTTAVAGLLAAATVTALALRRRRQGFSRPVGRRFAPASPDAQRLHVVLGAVQDLSALDVLERAQRAVARHCRDRGLPRLERVLVRSDAVEFHLADAAPDLPAGFAALGPSVWQVTREAAALLSGAPAPLAYPGLVSVGRSGEAVVLLDLESIGVLGVCGAGAEDVIAAAAVELAALPWAGELNIVATESLRTLLEAADVDVAIEPEASDAVVAGPSVPDARMLRLDPDRSADLTPRLAFVDTELARFTPHDGIGVVMPSATRPWRLDLDAGELVTPRGRFPIEAQRLPSAERAALTELFAAATSTAAEPASWWLPQPTGLTVLQPGDAVPRALLTEESAVTDPPRTRPEVLLLGPIDLVGCPGSAPARAQRQCVEYAAWLLEHPGGTASQMAAALYVAEGTRRSNVSRLRAWLGHADDGTAYLPEAYSGRLRLHPEVTSDWQRLQMLIGAGVNLCSATTLTTALSLVRGAPLADAAPSQWMWAEPMRSDMSALIRDIGVRLAELALEADDVELANWATARALAAAPEDELLLCARIRAAHRSGRRDDVERLVWRLTRQARALGVDLSGDTVALLQEVMEGQVRARAVS